MYNQKNMNSQLEIYYWQKLAGIITESQYYEKKRLLEDYQDAIEIMQAKYVGVGTGKITQDIFNKIKDAVNPPNAENSNVKDNRGKGAYINWLILKVANKLIDAKDISNFGEYIQIFNKNKASFDRADINLYKNADDIADFENQAINAREKDIEITGTPSDDTSGSKPSGLLTTTEVGKLKGVGIKFIGLKDGYQVFKVPQSLRGNGKAYKTYDTILGQCQGRDQGAKIKLCTIANKKEFDKYLGTDDLYVFYNISDSKSPYQFHYYENQFMDKDNEPVS